MKLVLCFLMLCFAATQAGVIPWMKPGDKARGFSLQTLKGLQTYKNGHLTNPNVTAIFFAFSNESAFLENMFLDSAQFVHDLFEYSPDNAHFMFMFYENARLDLTGGFGNPGALQNKFRSQLTRYLMKKWQKYSSECRRTHPMKNYKCKHDVFYKKSEVEKNYMSRLHFVRFPVHLLGNWIPRVLSQWHCVGSFCGLNQIAFVNKSGEINMVIRRLDARYTWLPSIDRLGSKPFLLVSVINACLPVFDVDIKGSISLVHISSGNCSAFAKVKNAQKHGARGVIFYDKDLPKELNCHGKECETYLSIPACIIKDVYSAFVGLGPVSRDTYVRFQNTPTDTFSFGIDGQGRVQKTDWFLYPSMRFAGYQAQWFNYETNFVMNTTGESKVLPIFKDRLLTYSSDGSFIDVALPPYKELVLYQNVEVEMSLQCPRTGSGSCTRWDHVIRLFISCNAKKADNNELTRWIAAFERRATSWITPIRSMLPLLKANETCRFTLMTQREVLPWLVTVKLRLSDKFKPTSKIHTWKQIEKELIPVQIKSLFTGCFFDENCNKKYKPITFVVSRKIARIKLVTTITGLGHDNNNCAGNCLTTHRFIINNKANSTVTRVYKDSVSSLGCHIHVDSESAKRKWLRAREPFCDGQEVIPWDVDISDYVKFPRFHGITKNTIQYRALFNGTDNRPIQNPGKILMSSYLVYYVYEDLTSSSDASNWF